MSWLDRCVCQLADAIVAFKEKEQGKGAFSALKDTIEIAEGRLLQEKCNSEGELREERQKEMDELPSFTSD